MLLHSCEGDIKQILPINFGVIFAGITLIQIFIRCRRRQETVTMPTYSLRDKTGPQYFLKFN